MLVKNQFNLVLLSARVHTASSATPSWQVILVHIESCFFFLLDNGFCVCRLQGRRGPRGKEGNKGDIGDPGFPGFPGMKGELGNLGPAVRIAYTRIKHWLSRPHLIGGRVIIPTTKVYFTDRIAFIIILFIVNNFILTRMIMRLI